MLPTIVLILKVAAAVLVLPYALYRSRVRFHLRGLIIVVAAVALCLGAGVTAQRGHERRLMAEFHRRCAARFRAEGNTVEAEKHERIQQSLERRW